MQLQYSLEAYFLVNFAIDTALITIVARSNGCMRFHRILIASFLAASYALLAETVSSRLTHPAIQGSLLILLGLIICGEPDIRRCCSLSVQLLGSAMILGGTGAMIPAPHRFPAALLGAGMILSSAILSIRSRRLLSWDVTVLISMKGRSVSVRALIDTGNRLREPISGLPVLIVESNVLSSLLDPHIQEAIHFRQVSFGVLGGGGKIRCFRPDCVLIRRGNNFIRAPEVWVAAYPGKIPGSTRALAPPSFAIIPGGRLYPIYKIHAKRGL